MPYLDNDGDQVYFRKWDTPNPTHNVLLLHGFGEHSGLFHRLAFRLNQGGGTVWALDHRAHGHTPGSFDNGFIHRLAGNARSVLAEIGRTGDGLPIVVVGHSLGGVVSALVMSQADAPGIAGLVLTGTPIDEVPEIDDIDAVVMSTDEAYLDALAVDPLTPKDIDFEVVRRGMATATGAIRQAMTSWAFPVLFVNGEHDPVSPPASVAEWASAIPRAKSFVIRGGHHDILNDASHRTVAELIAAFIALVVSDEVVENEVVK